MKTADKAPGTRRAARNHYSARDKCQAILSIWAERRKPSEVCQELGIQWGQLNQWQAQAMEGMLKALEPRTRAEEEKGPILGPKLQSLLERKAVARSGKLARLQERLARLQEPRQTASKPRQAVREGKEAQELRPARESRESPEKREPHKPTDP